jgi:hypothetical protein
LPDNITPSVNEGIFQHVSGCSSLDKDKYLNINFSEHHRKKENVAVAAGGITVCYPVPYVH